LVNKADSISYSKNISGVKFDYQFLQFRNHLTIFHLIYFLFLFRLRRRELGCRDEGGRREREGDRLRRQRRRQGSGKGSSIYDVIYIFSHTVYVNRDLDKFNMIWRFDQ